MRPSEQSTQLLDYRQAQASQAFVPQPAVLSSAGWEQIYFELHHQPPFETVEHQHTLHVIACGVSGDSVGERWLDGKLKQETRTQGDISIIPRGVSHQCNWTESAQFVILAIEPELLQRVGQEWVDVDQIELIPHYMTRPDALIQGILLNLKDELETPKIAGSLLIDHLSTTLAIHLLRHYCTTHPKLFDNTSGLSKVALKQVIDHIQAFLYDDLKLIDLAAIAQISPYHFLRLFKHSMGVTPHQFVLRCRIERAKSLLQQPNANLADIAVQVGFADQSHFTRQFKRIVGVTPRQLLQERSQ